MTSSHLGRVTRLVVSLALVAGIGAAVSAPGAAAEVPAGQPFVVRAIGDSVTAGFGYCGRLRTSAGSYCDGHAAMAVRRRDRPMPSKEIERIVTRFVEIPAIEAAPDADRGVRWRESA